MTRSFDFLHAQRRAIMAMFFALTTLGIVTAFRLPTGLLPDVTFPRISVIAETSEMPGEEVLRSVTRPLEEAVHGVPGVNQLRSTTSRGSAEINLDCRWGTDMDLTLQRVLGRIEGVRASLPAGTDVEARLMDPVLFPVLGISMVSESRTPAELRDLATMVIRPELARIPGVADVVIQGGRRLEARVALDPSALQARGLDAAGVADAVRRAGTIQSVGLLEANRELYLGLADSRPYNLEHLALLPIPVSNGLTVPLGELGTISLEEAPEFTRYAAQGREAVLINVLRQPTSSTLDVTDGVNRWIRESSHLLRGVRTEVFYDQSDLVRSSVGSVRDSLVVGAILAVLVVGLILFNLQLGLAAAAVLPATIGLTFLGLGLAHKSFNMMTLGGMAAAVGLVLDDAIVVVEHLAHRGSMPDHEGTSAAMAQILPSLVGSSLCTIVIFLPFMLLGGITGAFFRVLALSMVLMLTSSLAVCLAVLPLISRIRPARIGHRLSAPLLMVGRDLVQSAVSHGWIAAGALVILVLAIIPLQRTLGSGFLPEMDEGAIILDFALPPGTSLTEADAMLGRVEAEIGATPEIVSWSRRTGDELGFFLTEPNIGDYVLRLRDGKRRSAEEIEEDLRQRIESTLPAAEIEFGQLVEDAIGDLTTSAEPIEVRIYGEDRPLVEAKAREAALLLAGIRGVVDIKDGTTVSGPDFTIRPGSGSKRLGLLGDDFARAVEPLVAGIPAGEIVRGGRTWPIRFVLARPAGPPDLGAIGRMEVPVAPGHSMRLEDLAAVQVDPGETQIHRDNLRTMVPVTARLGGRDLGSAMVEVQQVLGRELPLPSDMSIRYAGQWAEQQSSFRSLASVMVGATAAVLLIFLISFRSWRQSGAVLAVVAASLAGVFAALHVGRATFNISSFVGAIMVVGIVSENAYFVIVEHRRGVRTGMTLSSAAAAAAERRARPVLMTTVAGIVALAPLALQLNRGSAMLSPLALAVVGGFLVSAPLLLLVLPSLLARAGMGE